MISRIVLFTLLVAALTPLRVSAQNDAMMQAFYWNVPVDEANHNGTWWDNLNGKATELKNAGINGLWIPAPSKGNWGITDMGYGIFDHYDLGNYSQRGTTETRFGSRAELENMIATMHSTAGGKPKINVYADMVLNHIYGDDTNEEVNPAVKQYVFDQAYRSGTQYVPYPTNEIKWVIPASAGTGDFYIKIKGYYLNWSGSQDNRAYDVQIDWTGGGFNGISSWESEPNGGNGQSNVFPATGRLVKGIISSSTDIDEYKVTVTTAHDIVIRLTARINDANWSWADQTNGYYPVEIWLNGVNLATSVLQARTNTSVGYVNHTGTGEANYTWHYTDFHPVDNADFLTNWDWNGGNSAIIPNTKAFGNDFNTYSTTVQSRLNAWGAWMANTIGFDGFRLDFVRGYQIDFLKSFVTNLPLLSGSQRFIVGEYWGPDSRIKEWVTGAATAPNAVSVNGFDFPLKSTLTDMCNGYGTGWDMRGLNHAGMVRNNSGNSLSGTQVVTWIENHDTGKEYDKWITKDWKMGYAYVLTHEGKPCIFYPHYYGVTLVDNSDNTKTVSIPSGLKDDINKLLFTRKTYLDGSLTVLSDVGNPYPSGDAYNVYVARRAGNATKSGAIVVINNHDSQTKGLWVDSAPSGWASWANTVLVNAFDPSQTTQVYSDGRVYVTAPARGYAVWVKQSEYVTYTAPGARTLTVGDASSIKEEQGEPEVKVWPNPAKGKVSVVITTPRTEDTNLEFISTAGLKIFQLQGVSTNQTHEIDMTSFPTGMYVLRTKTGLFSKSVKVLKE